MQKGSKNIVVIIIWQRVYNTKPVILYRMNDNRKTSSAPLVYCSLIKNTFQMRSEYIIIKYFFYVYKIYVEIFCFCDR